MRRARALVLVLAVLAAVGAIILVRAGSREAVTSRPEETIEVLVAVRAIASGETVSQTDVKWQPWPKNAAPTGSIQRIQGAPDAAAGFAPAPARFPLLQGEPLAEAKLIRPGTGSAMASLLAPGMRAFTVALRDDAIAGGAIQPLDRVDVMLARKAREGANSTPKGEILLRGVRVLAISKAPEGRGASTTQNRVATLEISPAQARRLVGAQGAGEISLALVAASEQQGTDGTNDLAENEPHGVKMMKFGRRQ